MRGPEPSIWRSSAWFVLIALALVMLALARPIDHDESQYVASAVLSAHGLLPYRDYAYLQTPLQPFLFAPIAWLAGEWAWPALRIANALLGVVVIACVWLAARIGGAGARTAAVTCGLLATCDILLFSIGTARNDALPAACLAAALIPILNASRGRATWWSAMLAGLLLAAAAAAKISYAVPALAYGIYALFDRRHRPLWIALGAAPAALFVGWAAMFSPQGFLFGVFVFPASAPAEYYAAIGRKAKLDWFAKAIDTLKFLALGPALAGLVMTRRFRWKQGSGRAIDVLLVAGAIAALLPAPTWRQYLLPMLPPLFVRLAIGWQARPPGQAGRIILTIFAVAGVAPTIAALATTLPSVPMLDALRQSRALRATLDAARVDGPIATLSPQFLPATGRLPDARFATGPFAFRATRLTAPADEESLHVVSRVRVAQSFRSGPPAAILTGGEGKWTSGDDRLDDPLIAWASAHDYAPITIPGTRFRAWIRPPAASPRPAPHNNP